MELSNGYVCHSMPSVLSIETIGNITNNSTPATYTIAQCKVQKKVEKETSIQTAQRKT